MPAPIEFKNIHLKRGETAVFHGLDLSLPGGVTSALLGESGAGKSSLLELINGLLRPTSGEVHVFGNTVTASELIGLRRRIGYAVQGTGLFPHLDVATNIALMAEISGWPAERVNGRVSELMELMALPADLARRYPYELSGGQQQRAGICRAMMLAPPILLLDEPFSGIDPVNRRDIHRRLTALVKAQGTTVVLVTHDSREALKLAANLVVLKAGRLVATGPPDTVLQLNDSYVRDLFEQSDA
ncbi:MAG: ATP-binding cassette domain-containing protein [Gammaproteobacteria bacterium]